MKLIFQELVIQLDERAVVERIEIIGHSCLIPTSIEVSLGDDPKDPHDPDVERALFMPAGEVPFNGKVPFDDTNCACQFQRIEFSRADKIKANFVRLVLKQNHITKHNDFNQVGLRGLSVIGTPDSGKSGGRTSRRGSRVGDFSFVPRRQDLAFLVYTDKDVAEVRPFI